MLTALRLGLDQDLLEDLEVAARELDISTAARR